jgi:hypothetical protein
MPSQTSNEEALGLVEECSRWPALMGPDAGRLVAAGLSSKAEAYIDRAARGMLVQLILAGTAGGAVLRKLC